MRRAQATLELLVLIGLAVALTVVVGLATGTDAPAFARHLAESLPGHRPDRRDDRWALRSDPYGGAIRRYVPELVLERDRYGQDAAVPTDPAVCRAPWCAAYGTGRPAIFTHVVRRPGATYVEYWFYYPDSRTLHAPIAALQGYHRDDWEGMVVRIADAGAAAARVTAHQGLVGTSAGWTGAPGWRPIGPHPVVYRAAGSHANGFTPTDIDAPLDTWNGTLARLAPSAFQLIAADTAPALRFRYDRAALPPWMKALWRDPEATGTGR
ncbi:MAG: hypothetical protein ACR2JV_05095 [Gaiellales bacterium]